MFPSSMEPTRFRILKMKGSWDGFPVDPLRRPALGQVSILCPTTSGHDCQPCGSERLGERKARTPATFFLWASRGKTIGAKRLVFDNGPVRTEDGRMVCTEPCPNRTLADGKLVPICMTDMEVRCEWSHSDKLAIGQTSVRCCECNRSHRAAIRREGAGGRRFDLTVRMANAP